MRIKKEIKMEKLLRSQVVYDYMLRLMGVTPHMQKRMPQKRFERETFDKARKELRYKSARTSFRLSRILQNKEQHALFVMLNKSALLRQQAMMMVLVEYGAYVDQKTFETNLKQIEAFKNKELAPSSYRVSSHLFLKENPLPVHQKA